MAAWGPISTKMSLLTVSEDDGHSDRITAVQKTTLPNANFSLKISIDSERKLTMLVTSNVVPSRQILDFPGLDIDGMIEYLQQVKTFVSEEQMVKELRGKQPNAFYAKR